MDNERKREIEISKVWNTLMEEVEEDKLTDEQCKQLAIKIVDQLFLYAEEDE